MVKGPAMIYHQQKYAAELEQRITPGCRWLDIGAGKQLHGSWGSHDQAALAKRAAVLVGCDIVKEHLAQNPYLTSYEVCRAERMPFAGESFDVVTANMVLEHARDPIAIFHEVRRVLSPGGMFIAVTVYRWHPAVFVASVLLPKTVRSRVARLHDHRPSEDVFPTQYKCNTVRAVTRAAVTAGLQVETVEPFQSLPWAKGWLRLWEAKLRLWSNLLVVLRRPAPEAASQGD